jgi:hypothetical protein
MSPSTVKVLLAVQIIVQAEFCARSTGAADVAPVDVIVTPAPATKLVRPVPIDCTFICSPIAKIAGGIVTTTALALDVVTNLPESAATNVYVVPVCALKERFIFAVLITGAVKVLLVKVSVPVNVATPVRVLLATLIVLLVKVCVAARPTKVSLVVAGSVRVLVPAMALA